jgi:hypothetical protein
MASVTMPTLLLIGQDTASPYTKQSINALRDSLPKPTVVVLERQEYNAMESVRNLLANEISRFASAMR